MKQMNNKQTKQLINHLHRLQGQLGGIEKMVADDRYCVDIIRQSLAAQKSLQSFNQAMLEKHLTEHAGDQFRGGKQHKAISELLDIYYLKNK